MNWPEAPTESFCQRVLGGGTPSTKKAEYYDGDVPWLRTQEVVFNYIQETDRTITVDGLQNSSATWIPENSVVVAMFGASAGRVAVNTIPLTTNQACCNLVIDPDKADYQYVFYALCNRYKALESRARGAAQNNLNAKIVREFTIPAPPVDVQRRIGNFLRAYDDLIKSNQRRIQLLEQSARLLYKEWFVHLRFPGHEHTTFTDGVPEGWENTSLGDVLVALESGGRPKGGAREKGIPSIGAENCIGIGKYDYSKEKYIPEEYFSAMNKGVVRNRDVVIYKDGANIGRSSYFGDGFPHERCAVNEHVFILRGLEDVGQNFFYFWVAQDETRQQIANLNANTAQPGVSQDRLKTLNFVQPHKSIAHLFNDTVEPTVRQIFLLARENRKLSKSLDLLLPHLMNGEIVV